MGGACAKHFSSRAGAFHLQQCAAASIGHRSIRPNQPLPPSSVIGEADSRAAPSAPRLGYSDEELAAIGNFVIGQFGLSQGMITPEQVRAQNASAAH